jgi:hypothetical protein
MMTHMLELVNPEKLSGPGIIWTAPATIALTDDVDVITLGRGSKQTTRGNYRLSLNKYVN